MLCRVLDVIGESRPPERKTSNTCVRQLFVSTLYAPVFLSIILSCIVIADFASGNVVLIIFLGKA